jgi:hypothetical protein
MERLQVTDGNSLINLGDLSKPVTVLIEKVSSAVGIVFEPRRLKRAARAEIEVEKLKALARIELSDIELRGVERLIAQEARKQENIEQITAQAAENLLPDADVEALEEDWVAHFFRQCDTVSDREMQTLWARLLSGEASQPGTYSKRTVEFISTMDKSDAELFTKFCTFVWRYHGAMALILDFKHEIYTKKDIDFNALKHLDSIGLISFEPVSGYSLFKLPKEVTLLYHDEPVTLDFPLDENALPIGTVLLTNIGRELMSISGSSKSSEFLDYVLATWRDREIIVSTPVKLG